MTHLIVWNGQAYFRCTCFAAANVRSSSIAGDDARAAAGAAGAGAVVAPLLYPAGSSSSGNHNGGNFLENGRGQPAVVTGGVYEYI